MEFGLVNFAVCAIVWFIAVTNAFVIHIIKEKVPDILWGITAIIWLGLLVFGLNLFPLGESLLTAFCIFFNKLRKWGCRIKRHPHFLLFLFRYQVFQCRKQRIAVNGLA